MKYKSRFLPHISCTLSPTAWYLSSLFPKSDSWYLKPSGPQCLCPKGQGEYLIDINQNISIEKIIEVIKSKFDCQEHCIFDESHSYFCFAKERSLQFKQHEWIWSKTPKFILNSQNFSLHVHKGLLVKIDLENTKKVELIPPPYDFRNEFEDLKIYLRQNGLDQIHHYLDSIF